MRITILTFGSRGDIQPYLALALGLKSVGHDVCIATEQIYEDWITQEGIEYAFLPGNSKERHANEAWFKLLEETHRRPIVSAYRAYREFLLPPLRKLLEAAWEACQGSDVILGLPTVYAGSHIAEKLGIPFFSVWTCPFTSTSHFPHAWSRLPSQRWAGGALNRFSYWVPQFLDQKVLLPTINQWRQETLALPPVKTHRHQLQTYSTLYNYSDAVLAKPTDWNDRIHLTGYWFLDRPEAFQPPEDLVQFLAAGPAPVYIGFGSIGDRHATRTLQTAVDAVVKSGQRAVLEGGWAAFSTIKLPPQILQLQSNAAPHAWLFPRMAALIHHGGAGTTAQGFRSGKPTVVVYQKFTDYHFWGDRVARLGVGPEPLHIRDLKVDDLTAAIHLMVSDRDMQARAAQLGRSLQQEDGIAQAIDVIHDVVQRQCANKLTLSPPVLAQ